MIGVGNEEGGVSPATEERDDSSMTTRGDGLLKRKLARGKPKLKAVGLPE